MPDGPAVHAALVGMAKTGWSRRASTEDGWILMGDAVEIDDDRYLPVVGGTSDLLIRAGKNISAPAVEGAVGPPQGPGRHPRVVPEFLVQVDDLPRSSGGKIAKGDLRQDAARRFAGAVGRRGEGGA